YDGDDLQQIVVNPRDAAGGDDHVLRRAGFGGRPAGDFVVVGTPPVRADRRQLDGWLRTLRRLEADRFVNGEVTAPRATLTLTPRDEGAPGVELRVGEPCDDTTVRVQRTGVAPATQCVAADLLARLLVAPSALRDTYAVGTAATDVVSLRFAPVDDNDDDSVVVDLARKDRGWTMRRPDGTTADDAAVDQLLETLVAARGTRVATSVGFVPSATLTIEGLPAGAGRGDAPRTEVIAVGRTDDGAPAVRREDDGAVLRLGETETVAFLPRPAALRSLQIFDVAVADVRRLTLACGKPQRLRREATSGAWGLEEPSDLGVRADVTQAVAYVDRLRTLRAVRWVSDRAAPEHELERPWCDVAMTVTADPEAGPPSVTLRLGARTPDGSGYFAQRNPEGPVFVVGRGVGVLAQQWFFDRTSLLVDVEEVARARVRGADGRAIDLEAREGLWVRRPAADDATPEDRRIGRRVREVVGDLIAEGAVDAGAPAKEHGLASPEAVIELWRAHADRPVTIRIGRGDVWRDTSVFYVRRDSVEATFAVAQSRLRPLLEML
ncbi:MAG: hypothetical protein AAGN82_00705, partial [Myxococcota bacterium]